MRILVFTRILPRPSDSGMAAYLADILGYLRRRGAAVRVAWTEPPPELAARYASGFPAGVDPAFQVRLPGCVAFGPWTLHVASARGSLYARAAHQVKRWLPAWRRPARPPAAAGTAGAAPFWQARAWDRPAGPEERRLLQEQVAAFRPDIVLVNYPWLLADLQWPEGPHRPHVAVLTHDFRHRDCQLIGGRFTAVLGDSAAFEVEKSWLRRADTVVAIQEGEARLFREALPGQVVLSACKAIAPHARTAEPSAAVCGFIGVNNQANLAGLRWFLADVWPEVRRQVPAAVFRVAGNVGEGLLPASIPAGVELLGRVAELSTFYAGLAVAVVPLLRGTGVKIKLVEALAYQCACVTTSVGADGLEDLRDGLQVADTGPTFAAAVIGLLREPDRRRAQVARAAELTGRYLTPDACYGPLQARFAQVMEAAA